MSYVKDNFLLYGATAEKLYCEYASGMPIFDYHCHLSEREIFEDKPFGDIAELWLGGDHYKWRLMRSFGISEKYITGDACGREKFRAYCTALGTAFGNPLYHWSQMELERFFGCELEINAKNADKIYDICNAYIKERKLTPSKLIASAGVKRLFTTNEAFDDLSTFAEIAKKNYPFTVAPAFRADKMLNIDDVNYNDYVDILDNNINSLDEFEKELEIRLYRFLSLGCKAADVSLGKVCGIASKTEAAQIFAAVRKGSSVSREDAEKFKGYMTYFFMKLFAKQDIVAELHIGPIRNNNGAMFEALGADTGYDSIASGGCIENLSALFDRLNSENALPRTIVFNLNPNMSAEITSLIGCFQSDEARGKMQYGAAWWFLDNKNGIEKQLADLSANGHIGTFVGMLTDSRSFLSYARHDYFRRILCSFFGGKMDRGEMTADIGLVGGVVKDICYNNAINYFKIEE